MNDDIDELDRALFALPLATPPPGLREAILRATIWAPPAASLAFRPWEIAGIGAALAVAVWLVILSVGNRTFGAALTMTASAVLRSFGEPATLAWFGTGGALAVLLSIANFAAFRPPAIGHRS